MKRSQANPETRKNFFKFRWNQDPKYNNTGCALTPHSICGSYWHEGQPQRQEIRFGQKGLYLRLTLQIIDTSRCKPLRGAQIDVWQATAMGGYSDKADGYLRGWQPTSKHGTVDFDTIFPRHYNDRVSHIHVAIRALLEKRVVSIGHIYFDQDLRDKIEVSILPDVRVTRVN
jgi:protocatechuate 3,4-dioxygenase beta subunit